MARTGLFSAAMIVGSLMWILAGQASADLPPIDIGSRLEPFMDDALIERFDGTELRLHRPRSANVAMTFDEPWEGPASGYVGVFKDGHRYRMYYRGCRANPKGHQYTCYAESLDGIQWTKPDLGLFEVNGSNHNNIVLTGPASHCFAAFKDGNPEAPEAERYKAISAIPVGDKNKQAIIAFVSPDGLNWKQMQPEPIITKGAFDSQNTAFWDAYRQCYVAYERDFRDGVRDIRTCTSTDFRHWTEPTYIERSQGADEHLYTNAIVPYFRAPHVLVGMPMRYHPDRRFDTRHPHMGASDGVFMTSRDGLHWDRRFLEAFILPGPDPANWTDRSNMPAWGVVPTGVDEMSVYWTEHYRAPGTGLRRGVLRADGFVSVRAPYEGGQFVTKPLVFTGSKLVLNYATSAAGAVRVEIQETDGTPIPGYQLVDGRELYGDEIARVYEWGQGSDVAALASKPVRLRFVMNDADLYSIRFRMEQGK